MEKQEDLKVARNRGFQDLILSTLSILLVGGLYCWPISFLWNESFAPIFCLPQVDALEAAYMICLIAFSKRL